MPDTVAERVRRWAQKYEPPSELQIDPNSASDAEWDAALEASERYYPSEIERVKSQIDFLASRLYCEYEITHSPPHQEFRYRLRDWLDSTPDEMEQRVLLELVPRIFFIGSKEYLSLYQSAFNGPVARWLIEQCRINICKPDAQTRLRSALRSTWFCAVTDSMQIARFCHVNQLEGARLRPDWYTLERLGSKEKILAFMAKQRTPLKRIVLLEDFIGTGTQMKKAVSYAASLADDVPVLLCPLVVAPSGAKEAQNLSETLPNLSFVPTLVLDASAILRKTATPHEDSFHPKLRQVIEALHWRVKGSNEALNPYGFGFLQEKGGLLFVMHTNCPNNTLPVIYYESGGSWRPLFPRATRA